jgi:transcription initiation factor TFIIB
MTEPGWQPVSERRAGPPSSVSRESVGTVIGRGNDDPDAARLAKYNNRLDHRTRALKEGLNEVRSLCSALELPETTETHAAHLYRRAHSARILQGRSQESISAACVYTAARNYHQPVTLTDVADASPVEEATISGAYRVLLRELDIGLRPPEPTDFLAKIAATADLPYRVQRRARKLLEQVMADQRHVGQSPTGVAAAALYAAARALDVSVTQAALADAAGVGTVTVSRQWQSFTDYLD